MKKRIIRDLLIIVVVSGGIWAVFTLFPVFKDSSIKVPISTEEKLGKTVLEQFILNNGKDKISDKYSDSCLSVIKRRILKSVGTTNYEYNLIVVENSTVNAVALPGGYIVVFSGLIDFCDNPDELTAVIAHEIGHIEKKHVINKLIKEFSLALITSNDKFVIGTIARIMASTAFDRKQEEEADKFALQTLTKSKINPRIMGSFFTRIEEKYGSDSKNIEMLSTHPFNNARIKASFDYPIPQDFKEQPFDFDWKKFKSVFSSDEELEK